MIPALVILPPAPLLWSIELCTAYGCGVDRAVGIAQRALQVGAQLIGALDPAQLVVVVGLGCLWGVTVAWVVGGGGPPDAPA